MAYIRIDSPVTIFEGQTFSFRSPADCSQVTGLIVYYPSGSDVVSKVFQFTDAHGEDVGHINDLFAANVIVKVVLDVNEARAFVQNADTNAYLEARFKEFQKLLYLISIPSPSGMLTYTGSSQSPSWINYTPDIMEMSGDTSGTNIGTYTTIFTLKNDEYTWADGTHEPKSVTWRILPAIISAIPSPSGTLIYNGSSQSPSWSNYDSSKMKLSGAISGTDAGTYSAIFTPTSAYRWNDGTTEAKTITWTIERAPVSVPSQKGTLTYNESAQSPSWNNYDSSKMTLSGTTRGTNAGSYDAIFTPNSNYKWNDGSIGDKKVFWNISKAEGNLTLNKSSMALDAANLTGTIVVAYAGDGNIMAESSNPDVATVNLSGNTITVTAKAKGEAHIIVSITEGTNHTASASKTCAVVVELPTPTLNDNSWETIRQVSDAGQAANYWAVGDTKSITINGTVGSTLFSNITLDAVIIGIDHNSTKEGTNRIHFQIGKSDTKDVCLCDSKYNGGCGSDTKWFIMNTDSIGNAGGWEQSTMRTTVLGNSGTPTSPVPNSLMAALPADLLVVMKSVAKYTDNTAGDNRNEYPTVTATTDYLFLLSELEVRGNCLYSNEYESYHQAQYDYYKAGNSTIRYKHNGLTTAAEWWLRSPYRSYSSFFCSVFSMGNTSYSDEYWSYGISPVFCV